jgi:5-methylcytosine-specific restriction protein A
MFLSLSLCNVVPQAPKKPCGFSRCPALVARGIRFCPAHAGHDDRQDRARRGSSAERGYDRRWQLYRDGFLEEFPLCGMRPDDAYDPPGGREMSQCLLQGRATFATVVHHIRGHHGPGSQSFYDRRNHEAGCESCHNAETARNRSS